VAVENPASQSSSQDSDKKSCLLVAGCAVLSVALACVSIMVIAAVFFAFWTVDRTVSDLSTEIAPRITAQPPALSEFPSEPTDAAAPVATVIPNAAEAPSNAAEIEAEFPIFFPHEEIDQTPLDESHWYNLERLMELMHPARDYYENATRLGPGNLGDRTVNRAPYQIGDRQVFRTDEGRLEADLLAITEHAYFWVDSSLEFNSEAVQVEADRFEEEFYPVVHQLFGEEWRPGVDNDIHFSVLHLAQYNGDGELGFFNSGDEYPWAIVIDSNQQEMVYLNMANLSLGDDLYHGTLIHEMQHLIQWHNDANESIWLTEGLAQLAELYAGLDTVDTVTDYLHNPDTQLNSWDYEDEDAIYAHYGAAYLFSVYLWEQLGKTAISKLAVEEADGLAAVRSVLSFFQPEIPLEQFVGNWAVANYLDDLDAGPEYGYANLRLHRPVMAEEISSADYNAVKSINQYGVHYIKLDHTGPTTVTFAGDTTTMLMEGTNTTSRQIWYAPAPDEIDAQLTSEVDLSGVDSASLDFAIWYDIELGFDFLYVTISSDGGVIWDVLEPDHSSQGEFGPALSGRSQDESDDVDGWVNESIDLSSYAGQEVRIRFELLTDSAISGGGVAIDNIEVPELAFLLDADNEGMTWSANGFAKIGRVLPQQWVVNLIEEGVTPRVTELVLDENNQGQWTIELKEDGGVLVVTALNAFVDTPASYWLAVNQ